MKTFIFKAELIGYPGTDDFIEVEAETLAEAKTEAYEIAKDFFAFDLTLEEED